MVSKLPLHNVVSLMHTCIELDSHSVLSNCVNQLVSKLDTSNVVEVLHLAEKKNVEWLVHYGISLFSINLSK
jgi:hypothetical protein